MRWRQGHFVRLAIRISSADNHDALLHKCANRDCPMANNSRQKADDEESVLDYARELKTRFSNPTEKQSAFIKKMIADRIKEIKDEL